MNLRLPALLGALATVVLFPSHSNAFTIDFDDGTDLDPVGSFYSGLGVEFSNATWATNFGISGSSGPLGIRSENSSQENTFKWLSDTPVVATFSQAVSEFSILGLDVGQNGLRVDAYDSLVGGNLIDFDEKFGTGVGGGQVFTLEAEGTDAAPIRRVEIYQLNNTLDDRIVLDNFTFEFATVDIPEPGTVFGLLGLGTAMAVGYKRKRV